MTKKKYIYPAGILNRRMNWVWQGEVVAFNVAQATKMLQKFKKRSLDEPHKFSASIMAEEKVLTKRKIGIRGI